MPKLPRPSPTLAVQGLRLWTARQVRAAVLATVLTATVIGLATVLIPNPVFGRDIPTVAWNYPVWIMLSILTGMLIATYVRPGGAPSAATAAQSEPPGAAASGRLGTIGAILGWFAVGCPVCNKIALLALGYAGALTWFTPIQPFLAAAAILLSGLALVWRLQGQVACPVPAPLEAVR
ncbi:MAG TPA: hypothetical protein VK095_02480 [Beutenbergiaceae bacterium]|nr:hypothetical protein [Beutenbergiaceae bacterium]